MSEKRWAAAPALSSEPKNNQARCRRQSSARRAQNGCWSWATVATPRRSRRQPRCPSGIHRRSGVPPGRPVSFIEVGREDSAVVVQSVVDRLLHEEGVKCEQLTVLCDVRSTLEQLRTLTAGGYPFVPPGATGVQVETIHRFKGLESPVVVLVIADPPATITDYARTLLYVGTSRARSSSWCWALAGSRSGWTFGRRLRRDPQEASRSEHGFAAQEAVEVPA